MKHQALKAGRKQPNLRRQLTVVDLFCGCGGVTEGLKHHNFRVIAAIDKDKDACKTYEANHPRVHLYSCDIRRVEPKDIRKSGNLAQLISRSATFGTNV